MNATARKPRTNRLSRACRLDHQFHSHPRTSTRKTLAECCFEDAALADSLVYSLRFFDRFGLRHAPLHDYLRKFD